MVLVTARVPNDSLYEQLMAREADFAASGLHSLTRIGDRLAPGTIAAAVYAGHRFAREFEAEPNDDVPFLVERPCRGWCWLCHIPPITFQAG